MYKQVIVVREDLRLSRGKLAVQVAHASLEAYKKSKKSVISRWEKEGSKKVVVKVKDLKELKDVFRKAKDAGIPCSLIRDAGKTEIKPGTITAVGIGPEDEKTINRITGKLKVYR